MLVNGVLAVDGMQRTRRTRRRCMSEGSEKRGRQDR